MTVLEREGKVGERDQREDDYAVDDLNEEIDSSQNSRLNLIEKQFELHASGNSNSGARSNKFFIYPDNRWYKAWTKLILIWAIYSSFFTPLEFGFFRGLPKNLIVLDIMGQIAFFFDIVLEFFVAFRDAHTYRMVHKRRRIAARYLKSHFVFDLIGCMPWDLIYKACGNKEIVRYFLWIRLSRARRVTSFLRALEKDIRINYMLTRILKLIVVELYCTHTAACIFYYLATTTAPSQEGYTWIGSLKMGEYTYSNFRDIDLWKRYVTSLYFAIVTMATVGYGDIHAVNVKEMIFVMIFVSFDMVLGAYLIGNMTALIVKGSKTERFRDKMTDLMRYMNRNKLRGDLRNQIKSHVRLQYECTYTDGTCLKDVPFSLRAKVSQTLYLPYVESVPLFIGCSGEFLNQIVVRLKEEFLLPGEVVMDAGHVSDQLYFVCSGKLEEVNGVEETVSVLEQNSTFGEASVICKIPQPHSIRVCELCRLLRIEKQAFSSVLEVFFYDARKILNNMVERKVWAEAEIASHIGNHEAELALKVNTAAFNGDLYQLKRLVRGGADAGRVDYVGRSPLVRVRLGRRAQLCNFSVQHLATCRGYEDMVEFLIGEGVDVNCKDMFGNSPLLEAVRNGHESVAAVLSENGGCLNIDDCGGFLCGVISKGDSDLLKRVLLYGADPNARNYDDRTPLHLAAAEGLHLMVKYLLDAGASVYIKDRWRNTPLDEGRRNGNKKVLELLEEAKGSL